MSNGDIFIGEFIGTAILILFGAGVCAAVTLHHSKARAAGWVVIAFGWGFGVLAGAYTAAPLSGGHLNPAVTVGVAVDTGEWGKVPLYFLGQMVGALLGAVLALSRLLRAVPGQRRGGARPSRRSGSSPPAPRSAIRSPTP